MKKIKKIYISLILSITIITTQSSYVLAAGVSDRQDFDCYNYYENQFTEVVNIDGTNYTYYYYLDEQGYNNIKVTSDKGPNVDYVKYNPDNGDVYLNNKVIGKYSSKTIYPFAVPRDANWDFWGSDSSYISWGSGVAAGTVAAVIASVLPSLGAAGVISAMGMAALAGIAYSSVGGTIYTSCYKFNSNLVTQFKYLWSFTASSGDYYGQYMYLTPIV